MLLYIANVLTADELDRLHSQLNSDDFIDGKATAGWHARLVKRNTQLRSDAPILPKVQSVIEQALKQNPLFQMAALPKTLSPILFSRYETGMSYGSHVDNAFMGDATRMRSDLSLTLFLSEPTAYAGGELVIESTQGEQSFKLDAGSMVLYPSSTLHRVEPVVEGVRMAAVAWVQSLVKEVTEREILFDLETARQAIFAKHGKTAEFDLLSKTYANLLRKWGDL
ncbi:MAG: Fe2+-dependent dioxygenase [Oscillatoriophycideae cyanobacterium NC_groundwater_1537_Pr4_S-0.65um_50_18]|nr:Fe2+-dependent dioxygenase [Oscillatoriophycideae cyanobacterium NC_groundwater_1537_Pr4_S-0.65um_50_18]